MEGENILTTIQEDGRKVSMKKDKLKKIIEYGVERGWNYGFGGKGFPMGGKAKDVDIDLFIQQTRWQTYFFSHDFAKAVFQKKKCLQAKCNACWQHHLQQAVISKNVIQYYHDYIQKK